MSTLLEFCKNVGDFVEAVEKAGEWFQKSGLFGSVNAAQARVIALNCLLNNQSPLRLHSACQMINGELSVRPAAALARFRSLGGRVRWTQFDEASAVADWEFEGVAMRIEFSAKEAAAAGLDRNADGRPVPVGPALRAQNIKRALMMLAPETLAVDWHSPDVAFDVPILKAQSAGGAAETKLKTKPAPTVSSKPELPAIPKIGEIGSVEDFATETVQEVQELLAEHDAEAAALSWFRENGWLRDGQSPAHLTAAQISKILERPQAFVRTVKNAASVA